MICGALSVTGHDTPGRWTETRTPDWIGVADQPRCLYFGLSRGSKGGLINQTGFEIIRPPLWGMAIALLVGVALIGPRTIIPQASEFTYLLGALSMAILYMLWRTKGLWLALALVVPLAIIVGWSGIFSSWLRIAAIGMHAGLSLLFFVLILGWWWRWIGVRLPIGRFVLVTIGFSIAGLAASWIDGLMVETHTLESGLAQLDLIGRNLLLGASFALGLEVGELRRRGA